MNPWQLTQCSRHPDRPHTIDYIQNLFTEFAELHGDRHFSDDRAVIGGTALFQGQPVMILGHQKGRNTKQKVDHNFGMARPEGYRKAQRLMKLAEKFGLPLICFVDTPGAYPGLDAEERGQSQAIAECLETLIGLQTPTYALVIGEGGSGGALALAATDHIVMLSCATYSVISPESCAAILWNDSTLAELAAHKIKLDAESLLKMQVIDEILEEPEGGSHHHPEPTYEKVKNSLSQFIQKYYSVPHVSNYTPQQASERFIKIRKLGSVGFEDFLK